MGLLLVKLISVYAIGLLFGIGISVSGMSNPSKVINFFDVAGNWDPSLAFVMASALAVTFLGYRLVFRRVAPVLASSFNLPGKTELDAKLIGGAMIFGLGWGIAGFCPGGALPALGTARVDVTVFIVALIAGIFLAKRLQTERQISTPPPK